LRFSGKKLKSTSGWNNNGNGTDSFQVSALPGGLYYGGSFYNAGSNGYWWTAAEYSSGNAYYRGMHYYFDYVYEYNDDKSYGFSLRCLQND